MATRSLTEVFILMRNNAAQNRHLFSEQVSRLLHSSTPESPESVADDRMALVGRGEDAEMGIVSRSRLPPEWVDGVEEVQFEISRIKQKMKDLAVIHDKYLNRPTLDDSMDEEHAIEITTQEITQMFGRCQRLVQQIGAKSRGGSTQEQRLTVNITSSLARTVTELSSNFRKTQSDYLKKMQMREERSKQYFDTDLIGNSDYSLNEEDQLLDRGFSDVQLQKVEDNTEFVRQREQEVNKIVQSINDLNEIFKDLATMIVDQGTLLDRIDYNIEQTATRVDSGLKQLQKAEKYQKKNRKMLIITILFVLVILLILILIIKQSLS